MLALLFSQRMDSRRMGSVTILLTIRATVGFERCRNGLECVKMTKEL